MPQRLLGLPCRPMSSSSEIESLKRNALPKRLIVAAVIVAGIWLLDRFIAERGIQLLIIGWLIAATACGLALRSQRAKPHWWTLPAWMLGGSALCILAGLLTLRS